MSNPNDANIVVDGQKVVATLAQSGTVVQDGGAIDATSVIMTESGEQKVVKTYQVGGGGGGSATWGDISGTLSNQTDLQNALDNKVNINNQNIKSYHAPSVTFDQTLQVIIPNVDAVQEEGLYNVDYTFENEGAILEANCILSVGKVSISDVVAQIDQTMVIGLNGSYVYLNRNYINGQWSAWEGKNIPVELLKCLQNTATGTDSVSILTNTTSANNIVAINANINNGINNGDVVIGKYCYTSSTGDNCNRVVIGNNSSATGNRGIAIGNQCSAIGNQNGCISIGAYSKTKGDGNAIAIGIGTSSSTNQHAEAKASNAIQLGNGTNAVAKQFQVYTYPMLDGNTGLIPLERLGTGYDVTKTQVLKHINGVATWVDE